MGKAGSGTRRSVVLHFQRANRKAVSAFEASARYLKNEVPSNSVGRYAIGADNYRRKLAYDEMVDMPLDGLLAIGESNLEKDYAAFLETAKRIDAQKPAGGVMKSISDEHPTEKELLQFAKSTIRDNPEFIIDKRIIGIPPEVRPSLLPTPPYVRGGTYASMDTPGLLEEQAKEAFYYITPTEPDWTAEHKQEHLRVFNKPVMDIITIH
jgi:hypothetical protein